MKKQELERLKRKAQKPRYSVIPALIHRKISIRITYYLIKTNISPNQITVLGFLVTLLAALLFLLGDYFYMVIAAILVQFGFVLDCVDGEIARIKSIVSKRGSLLDLVLDRVGHVILLFCIGYRIAMRGQFEPILVWTLLYLSIIGLLLMTVVSERVKNLRMGETGWKGVESKVLKSKHPIGWGGGTDEFIIAAFAILNQPFYAILAIAIGSNLHWLGQFILNMRKM